MAKLRENWQMLVVWVVAIALFNVFIRRVGDVNVWALVLLNFTILDIFAIWALSEFWVS